MNITTLFLFLIWACVACQNPSAHESHDTPQTGNKKPDAPQEEKPDLQEGFDLHTVNLDGSDGDIFELNDSWLLKIVSGSKKLITELEISRGPIKIHAIAKRNQSNDTSKISSLENEILRTKQAQGAGVVNYLGDSQDSGGHKVLLLEKLDKTFSEIDYNPAYFLSLVQTLERLHKGGVIHGDIKPGNIMTDTTGVIKFIDFSPPGMGTVGYSDKIIGTEKGDISALGLTVLESKYRRSLQLPHYRCHPGDLHAPIRGILNGERQDYSGIKKGLNLHACRHVEMVLEKFKTELEKLTKDELIDKLEKTDLELRQAGGFIIKPKDMDRRELVGVVLSNLLDLEHKSRFLRIEAILALLNEQDPVDNILKKMVTFGYEDASQLKNDLESIL